MKHSSLNPYQVLFPVGLFFGVWGAFLWLTYGFKLTDAYPGAAHANVMMGGFLFSFAGGFLMTAIPQFTGTDPASRFDIFGLASLVFGFFACIEFDSVRGSHLFLLTFMIFLIQFGARRFVRKQYSVPESFVFVGLGLFLGAFGMFLTVVRDFGMGPSFLEALGRLFSLPGVILSLVIGIGTRLVPALTGHHRPRLLQIQREGCDDELPVVRMPRQTLLTAAAVILLVSFFIEVGVSLVVGRLVRAAVVTAVAVPGWKMLRLPLVRSPLSFGLWFSGWLVLAGLWGQALWPSYGIHLIHLTFIGGFGLMTLMIATRVTLAHGDYDLGIESKSKTLWLTLVLVVLASLTRVSAAFIPAAYRGHLGYAAATWITGLLLWSVVFLPKIVKVNRS